MKNIVYLAVISSFFILGVSEAACPCKDRIKKEQEKREQENQEKKERKD
jgi:hypothetical protein